MKILIALLLMCNVCFANEWDDSIDKNNPDEVAILNSGSGSVVNGTHQLQKCDLVIVRQINRLEKKVKDIQDSIDKIYSMVADLEIKFMGAERYKQIYDPTNEGEVAKQKRWEKERIKELEEALRKIEKITK